MQDGVFLEWDLSTPLSGISAGDRDQLKQKPDWRTTIERDLIIQPGGSGGVRILVLNRNHLTGTGSYTYVFGFRCNAGSVDKIFEASGQGVRFDKATDSAIDITVGIWRPSDPHCCPSREEHLRYVWSQARKRFVRERPGVDVPWLP